MLTSFGIRKSLQQTYEQALASVPEVLKAEGFGVLTEIDVQATLKQKIGVDFRRYKIMGACNPTFAHEGLSNEIELGLLMPCNVVVYENDSGKATVLMIDPVNTIAATGNAALATLAGKVKQKLESALAKLS